MVLSTSRFSATPALDQSLAWKALQALAARFVPGEEGEQGFDLCAAFADDPGRLDRFSRTLHDPAGELLHMDSSKSHVDAEVWEQLLKLADSQQVLALRDAMFAGEVINASEQRQVMHWLLRTPDPSGLSASLKPVWDAVQAARDEFLAFAESVRANPAITDVVNIGIGGSDLGPCMAVQALRVHTIHGKRFHFVSNVDGHALQKVLEHVRPESTLFIVSSKSFSTLETMVNARTALEWFGKQTAGTGVQVRDHFVGSPPTQLLLLNWVSALLSASGTGSVAGIPCGRPLACRWPLPSAPKGSCSFWLVPMRWTGILLKQPLPTTCRYSWG
jgi:Glucose-6-phosphate isomerase